MSHGLDLKVKLKQVKDQNFSFLLQDFLVRTEHEASAKAVTAQPS